MRNRMLTHGGLENSRDGLYRHRANFVRWISKLVQVDATGREIASQVFERLFNHNGDVAHGGRRSRSVSRSPARLNGLDTQFRGKGRVGDELREGIRTGVAK